MHIHCSELNSIISKLTSNPFDYSKIRVIVTILLIMVLDILSMTIPSWVIHSPKKWHQISIWIDVEWWTRFFAKELTPWLSMYKIRANFVMICWNMRARWLSHRASLAAQMQLCFTHWGLVHSWSSDLYEIAPHANWKK